MVKNTKTLSENEKDWDNPVFKTVYLALALADWKEPGDELLNWLNNNGFCNLTVCPECHVDDFVHVEGCKTGDELEAMAKTRHVEVTCTACQSGSHSDPTVLATGQSCDCPCHR